MSQTPGGHETRNGEVMDKVHEQMRRDVEVAFDRTPAAKARADKAVAEAFGRTASVDEAARKGTPMTVDEALDVIVGSAFGRVSDDDARVAEAQRVLDRDLGGRR